MDALACHTGRVNDSVPHSIAGFPYRRDLNGRLFSDRDGSYVGTFDGDTVWDAAGNYIGELVPTHPGRLAAKSDRVGNTDGPADSGADAHNRGSTGRGLIRDLGAIGGWQPFPADPVRGDEPD
jgi:hypothetical protein